MSSKVISLRIEESIYDKLLDTANAEDMSVSQLLNVVLARAMENKEEIRRKIKHHKVVLAFYKKRLIEEEQPRKIVRKREIVETPAEEKKRIEEEAKAILKAAKKEPFASRVEFIEKAILSEPKNQQLLRDRVRRLKEIGYEDLI